TCFLFTHRFFFLFIIHFTPRTTVFPYTTLFRSPEQQHTRSLMLSLLDTVRDESGKDAPVRLVFEPKSSRIDRDEFVNTLLTQTRSEEHTSELQSRFDVVCRLLLDKKK